MDRPAFSPLKSPPHPWVVTMAAVAGAVLAGCFSSKTCTEVGCQDQFHATIVNADGSLQEGTHVVEVAVDGVTLSCTFQLPLPVLPSGGISGPPCPIGLSVFVAPEVACTETNTGSVRSRRCEEIPGRFVEHIIVFGAPAELHLRQTVNGTVVLDRTETPHYTTNQPNGLGCEPVCRQASPQWTWTFAAP